jgi:hypothetical protein
VAEPAQGVAERHRPEPARAHLQAHFPPHDQWRVRGRGACACAPAGQERLHLGLGSLADAPLARGRSLLGAAHPEIKAEWLPPYVPELDPEAYCHGNVKERMRSSAPSSVEQMRQQVERGFNRLRRLPDLLLSFTRHAGLNVKQLF